MSLFVVFRPLQPLDVEQILGSRHRPLVAQQVVQSEDRDRDLAVGRGHPGLPGIGEAQTLDRGDDVDAVGLDADLGPV